MTITRVEVYEYTLTYVHGEYVMSGGRVIDRSRATSSGSSTDEGVDGFGEVCPLGPAYLPAHARRGPRRPGRDRAGRDRARRSSPPGGPGDEPCPVGHAYAKSASTSPAGTRSARPSGCRCRAARRPLAGALSALLRGAPRAGGGDGGVRRRAAAGRLHRFQLKLGGARTRTSARTRPWSRRRERRTDHRRRERRLAPPGRGRRRRGLEELEASSSSSPARRSRSASPSAT